MTHPEQDDAARSDRAKAIEWRRRGLTPPWVVEQVVRDRLALAAESDLPSNPPYHHFLGEPEDDADPDGTDSN